MNKKCKTCRTEIGELTYCEYCEAGPFCEDCDNDHYMCCGNKIEHAENMQEFYEKEGKELMRQETNRKNQCWDY